MNGAAAEARYVSIMNTGWDPALGINWNDVDYSAQANAQHNRLAGNLDYQCGNLCSADAENCDLVGGHCNFGFTCTDWDVCGPGRYDDGIHVECASGGYDCSPGDPLIVHDDTVRPWVGSFSFGGIFTYNFWEHGIVDLIGGTFFVGAFSQ